MNFTKKLMSLAFVSFLTLSISSCSDDDENTNDSNKDAEKEMTIAEFAASNENYSSLVAALDKADLISVVSDTNANLTVFAPDNAAFERFLTAAETTLEEIPVEDLRAVLLNHVLADEVKADAVVSNVPTYAKTSATGPKDLAGNDTNLSLFIDAELTINGTSEITGADAFDASNGVIHAVSEVIGLPKISTFVVADARVSTLKDVLIAQDLVATVDDLNPATVFAPLNDAFAAVDPLPTGAALTGVLTYHVISGVNVVASDLPALAGSESPATVQGETINILDGPAIQGAGNAEASGFVVIDIQATNGVIHVIDSVLLPE